MLDAPVLRVALQGVTLATVVLVCVVGLSGSQVTERNLAPWVFYIIFWVGLVPASPALGPVWRVLNPLRLVHMVLAAVLHLDQAQGVVTLPVRVGYWPAAVSLAVFAWLELVYPGGSEPVTVAVFALGYAVVHSVAALLVGRCWFERGDGFEVYSAVIGAMAPIGRRTNGRLVLRNPFEGLDAIPPAPGLVGVVVALVGFTAYDGLSHTSRWIWTGTVNATRSDVHHSADRPHLSTRHLDTGRSPRAAGGRSQCCHLRALDRAHRRRLCDRALLLGAALRRSAGIHPCQRPVRERVEPFWHC
jgi:hypothetical protein